jgi:hypothetical protein
MRAGMIGTVVDAVLGALSRGLARRLAAPAVLLGLAVLPGAVGAQQVLSVPFPTGFVGTRGSSAGTANDALTFTTLQIARIFFVQSSSTNLFQVQGNDVPGTLRIVRTDGTTLSMPALANWRNSGGSTYLIGFLPRPASPITLRYAADSIQITDGSNPGGTSIGGYVAAYSGARLADGADESGNAATSGVVSGLNNYLATVVASRPAGPVTVNALTTSSTSPTITGTATLGAGEQLSVDLAGRQYTATSTPAIVGSGNVWSLTVASPLALDTYSVTATVTNADGFTLSDNTTNELRIASGGGTLTLGGSFTATGRSYDGTVVATGATGGLTLVGVVAPDQVTIAGVTLAFQAPAAGSSRTVVVAGVTLGGTNAASYTMSYAGAPTATATIAPAPLTITGVAAADKTYDGTTTATLSGAPAYAGLVAGESFAVTGTPGASFAAAGVGSGRR